MKKMYHHKKKEKKRKSTREASTDNEGPRDWHILFAVTRFRCIEVLIHIFYYYWGKENRLL